MSEEFLGHDLDLESCDALLITRWSSKDRKREVELMRTKWFDHRVLHPTHATYLFAHIFTRETRAFIRANINPAPPKIINGRTVDWEPIKAGDIFEPPTGEKKIRFWKSKITSLIRARQIADQFGIPYEFFIRAGLRAIYFGRFNILNSAAIPSPQMLLDSVIIDKVLLAWGDALSGRIYCASHPRYLVANGDEHADVAEHQKWLCDQIARKADPSFALAKFIRAGFLSRDVAAARFGENRVAGI
jgi:hypothetical protein